MNAAPTASRPRVLVADDHADSAETLAALLRSDLDCTIDVARNGVEALALADAHWPDAIVFDLDMPGLDGIEAARRLRGASARREPFSVAMTGQSVRGEQLAAIDGQFDAVFSKPIDIERLVAALRRGMGSREGVLPQLQRFEFSELFTLAAREVVPRLISKRLGFSFDYRGPLVVLEDDGEQIRRGLHRLLWAMVDTLQAGFVILSCEATHEAGGRCSFVVTAAGAGVLAEDARITEVIARLGLYEGPKSDPARPPVRSARGNCPNTGGALQFVSSAADGVLLRVEIVRQVGTPPATEAPSAGGARAWLIDKNDVGSSWLLRRLQRMGWAVIRLDRCEDAMSMLNDEARRVRSPALVVVVESPSTGLEQVAALKAGLPASTQFVFAVPAGSPALALEDPLPGFDVRVFPFSPRELEAFTLPLAAHPPTTSGVNTLPGALILQRPAVLVVDDNEVNRIVASEMLEVIGYRVATASNGLEAIEHCKRQAPLAVLMDLSMPVVDGIAATHRLRELQRLGSVSPFSIVGATADGGLETRHACLRAGMDGFLSKPLSVAMLRQELKRVTTLN